MLTGSCLCGEISYQVTMESNVDAIIFCHCQRCRKWSGTAFNSAIVIKASEFQFLSGQDTIKKFSINGVNRHFCGQCGSNLFTSRDNNKEFYRLRAGTIDTPVDPKQRIHIYADAKANWDTICDGGTKFSENIK
ncbi:GFA family protein [Orbus sturtevantii]|uniref:GFA family protein n=1 Tax=Orbus sturtevantii TaxID=3074109 RepID=UPI00370DA8D3